MIYTLIITNLVLSCLVFFLINRLRKQKEENVILYNESNSLLDLCDDYNHRMELLLNSYNEVKNAINDAVKRGDYTIVVSKQNYSNITNNYNIDEILNEIYINGIDKIDKNKLEYLKNFKNK